MERQIATTREQSDRLLKCGVPAESADMCWMGGFVEAMPYKAMLGQWLLDSAMKGEERTSADFDLSPAFSLSALLGLLPFKIHSGNYEYWLDVAPMDYGKQWSIGYYCTEKPRVIKGLAHTDSLIECAVLMVEWLTANGYTLNGAEKGGEK